MLRRVVTPERRDEPVDGDDLIGGEAGAGRGCAGLRPVQQDDNPVCDTPPRSEDAELEQRDTLDGLWDFHSTTALGSVYVPGREHRCVDDRRRRRGRERGEPRASLVILVVEEVDDGRGAAEAQNAASARRFSSMKNRQALALAGELVRAVQQLAVDLVEKITWDGHLVVSGAGEVARATCQKERGQRRRRSRCRRNADTCRRGPVRESRMPGHGQPPLAMTFAMITACSALCQLSQATAPTTKVAKADSGALGPHEGG